jgi:hypothetical protein
MTIRDITFQPPIRSVRSKRNTLFQMRRKIIFMHYPQDTVPDELGAYPYNDMEDYITGPDGTGVWCDIDTPHPEDVLLAAQHAQVITHSILIRFDPRIDPRMLIRYPNYLTNTSRYWYIRTLTNPDFEWHYLRIGAEEIIEYSSFDEVNEEWLL